MSRLFSSAWSCNACPIGRYSALGPRSLQCHVCQRSRPVSSLDCPAASSLHRSPPQLKPFREPEGEQEAHNLANVRDGVETDLADAEHLQVSDGANDLYLLRGLRVDRPNQVRSVDITYLADAPRLSLLGGNYRLANPDGSGLEDLQHTEY